MTKSRDIYTRRICGSSSDMAFEGSCGIRGKVALRSRVSRTSMC